MNILHVTNVAGVPSMLVQGLRKRGIEADLVVRRRHPYGFPHETVVNISMPAFWLRVLKLSQNYDLAHIHGLAHWTSFNIHIFVLKTSRAKLVIHLHGTELRKSHNKPWTKAALGICNQVLVGTPDLLPYYPKAVWLSTPVDPAFKPSKNPRRYGRAVYFTKWYEPEMEKILQMKCDKMGLELTVPRKPIPYSEMPLFLNQFEVFFDRFAIPSLSKTALEALACGCKVISWKGHVTNAEEMIKNHSLSVVTEKLIKIYEKLLN